MKNTIITIIIFLIPLSVISQKVGKNKLESKIWLLESETNVDSIFKADTLYFIPIGREDEVNQEKTKFCYEFNRRTKNNRRSCHYCYDKKRTYSIYNPIDTSLMPSQLFIDSLAINTTNGDLSPVREIISFGSWRLNKFNKTLKLTEVYSELKDNNDHMDHPYYDYNIKYIISQVNRFKIIELTDSKLILLRK